MRKGTTKNISWGNHCTGQHSNLAPREQMGKQVRLEVLLAITRIVFGSGDDIE